MGDSRLMKAQIAFALRQAKRGMLVAEINKKLATGAQTSNRWKSDMPNWACRASPQAVADWTRSCPLGGLPGGDALGSNLHLDAVECGDPATFT